MATEYKYSLDRSSKKFICPKCRRRRFVRYVAGFSTAVTDKVTDAAGYLPEQYGRCDRADHCGYFLDPYKDGYGKSIGSAGRSASYSTPGISGTFRTERPQARPDPAFIPEEILQRTIANGYAKNVFIQNLLHRIPFPFDPTDVEKVIAHYRLGTVATGYRAGALTIPYIDEKGRVRAIQVKQFDGSNHTTATDSLPSIIAKFYHDQNKELPSWLIAYQKNELKVSCLFGAHLLGKYPQNRIALVEAPKTAIYGTLYFGLPAGPGDLLWLGVYSRDTLTYDRCKVLEGRTVYLFPDLSEGGKTFSLWKERAANLCAKIKGLRIAVSDLIERFASPEEKNRGLDIADYLSQLDWRGFRKTEAARIEVRKKPNNIPWSESILPDQSDTLPGEISLSWQTTNIRPGAWDEEISELDEFFSGVTFPETPFMLNPFTPIGNVNGFIRCNLETARAQNGNPTYWPYLNRVIELKNYIQNMNSN